MSQLTKSIAELTAQLTAKDNEIASLKNCPRDNNNSSRNNNHSDRRTPTRNNNEDKSLPDRGGYCWTQGYRVASVNHTSANCRYKDDGHKNDATRDNNMGGSQHGKPRA
jgi:uncharacterized Rmd1/YagE family protein